MCPYLHDVVECSEFTVSPSGTKSLIVTVFTSTHLCLYVHLCNYFSYLSDKQNGILYLRQIPHLS